jgi:hypothetical protein
MSVNKHCITCLTFFNDLQNLYRKKETSQQDLHNNETQYAHKYGYFHAEAIPVTGREGP